MSWKDYRKQVLAQITDAQEAIKDIEENGYRFYQLRPGSVQVEHTDIMLQHYRRTLEIYTAILERINARVNG